MTIFLIVGAVLLIILTEKYWGSIKGTSSKLDKDFLENNKIEETSNKRLSPMTAGHFGWLDLWLNYSSIDDKKEENKK